MTNQPQPSIDYDIPANAERMVERPHGYWCYEERMSNSYHNCNGKCKVDVAIHFVITGYHNDIVGEPIIGHKRKRLTSIMKG